MPLGWYIISSECDFYKVVCLIITVSQWEDMQHCKVHIFAKIMQNFAVSILYLNQQYLEIHWPHFILNGIYLKPC